MDFRQTNCNAGDVLNAGMPAAEVARLRHLLARCLDHLANIYPEDARRDLGERYRDDPDSVLVILYPPLGEVRRGVALAGELEAALAQLS